MNLVEFIIRLMGPKKILSNELEFQKALNIKKNENKNKIPKMMFKSNVSKEAIRNSEVLHLFMDNTDKAIIYLHGGCYVSEASVFHYKFVDRIVVDGNVDVYFPLYPLVPNNTYKETYELLVDLYNKLIDCYKEVIFMGDSAGGGLALAFVEYLNEKSMPMPSKLILISPWVDISMSNVNLLKYEDMDPMLSIFGLKESGKLWAGDLDVKDYKVSPIYGNLSNIPKTLLFVGTREVFYPDIVLLHEKLIENNIDSELIVGKNMNHIYPIYPISYGKDARKLIIEMINK